jgi:hypothetical protein
MGVIMKTNYFKYLLSIGLFTQILVTPVQAFWVWHQPAPVVVHHRPIIVHQAPVVVDPVAVGICAAGVGLFAGISGWMRGKAENRKFDQYKQMFKDLGYDNAQARVYAKLAMNNPGGFEAVVANIERDKRLKYERETEKQLRHQDAKAQKELSQIKHHQKIEQMTYEKQSQKNTYEQTILVLLMMFLLLGIIFFSVVLFQRLKRTE